MCDNNENAKEMADKTYCATGEETPKMGKNAVVLSSKRYDRLVNNATNMEHQRIKKKVEEARKYQEYLKKGNEALVAKFTGKMKRTEMEKIKQLTKHFEEKAEAARVSLQLVKDDDEMQRRERVAQAQELLEKLKPGPRQLRSAAIQSEILHARDVHKHLKDKYKNAINLQECADMKQCDVQNEFFVKEEQENIQEKVKTAIAYKADLLKAIGEKAKQRAEMKERTLREERKERAAIDEELKAQIERERALMERKRATLRKNALEAMKMVEQRRLREQMIDEVENRICCVYNAGKNELDKLRNEQNAQLKAERYNVTIDMGKGIAGIEARKEAKENERLRRDITTMQLKFTAEEREKVNRERNAKRARIEAYCREVAAMKYAKLRAQEEKRFEMANRFKNSEVNCLFNEAQKEERSRRFQDVRTQLGKQIKEKQDAQKAERAAQLECETRQYEEEDKFFFQYANNLMQHAKQKQRPLYPFMKAVQSYKRENQINCPVKTPKHLVTNVNVGSGRIEHQSQRGGYGKKKHAGGRNIGAPQPQMHQPRYSYSANKNIMENCEKIDKLLGETCATDVCKPQDPIECYKQNPCKSANKKPDECGDQLPPPSKLRYSMNELKNMNQFDCLN